MDEVMLQTDAFGDTETTRVTRICVNSAAMIMAASSRDKINKRRNQRQITSYKITRNPLKRRLTLRRLQIQIEFS